VTGVTRDEDPATEGTQRLTGDLARILAAEVVGPDVSALYVQIQATLQDARHTVVQTVNVAMVHAYWNIGRLIDDHLRVDSRSETYGARLVAALSARLRSDFGAGFEATNLRYMRLFYSAFQIHHAARDESSNVPIVARPVVLDGLSWTHYRLLTKVHQPAAREFYMNEAARARWSTRELERQINTRYFERGLAGTDPFATGSLAANETAESVLRDPYVLEFLGLPDRLAYSEEDLEQALIDQLQAFLLELGRGFSFVGRQQRISVDGNHFHVDLVFYNYVVKAFVLIDLKAGKLDHSDIGQMDFYVRYWEAEVRATDDNPTIGLILCAEKSEAMARYTLLSDHQSIFAAKYLPYLPTEEELQRELEREQHVFEMRQMTAGDT
jgi:predicted nuclease of restriction endonuclease-like (RecB) superfamily